MGKRPLRDVPGTEAYIKQRAVINARHIGYKVHSTSSWRAPASRGVADTYSSHPSWGNLWVAVDFKRANGTLTPEQQELVDDGQLYIARTVDEFLSILYNAHPGTQPRV